MSIYIWEVGLHSGFVLYIYFYMFWIYYSCIYFYMFLLNYLTIQASFIKRQKYTSILIAAEIPIQSRYAWYLPVHVVSWLVRTTKIYVTFYCRTVLAAGIHNAEYHCFPISPTLGSLPKSYRHICLFSKYHNKGDKSSFFIGWWPVNILIIAVLEVVYKILSLVSSDVWRCGLILNDCDI